MSLKRKSAHPQRANAGKRKKAISESTVNSQRIGITLKLEAIRKKKKTLSVQGQIVLLMHFISLYLQNEIIHILIYFTETRQVGLFIFTNYNPTSSKNKELGSSAFRLG